MISRLGRLALAVFLRISELPSSWREAAAGCQRACGCRQPGHRPAERDASGCLASPRLPKPLSGGKHTRWTSWRGVHTAIDAAVALRNLALGVQRLLIFFRMVMARHSPAVGCAWAAIHRFSSAWRMPDVLGPKRTMVGPAPRLMQARSQSTLQPITAAAWRTSSTRSSATLSGMVMGVVILVTLSPLGSGRGSQIKKAPRCFASHAPTFSACGLWL